MNQENNFDTQGSNGIPINNQPLNQPVEPPKKKKHTALIVILIIVALVAIVGVLLFVFVFNQKDKLECKSSSGSITISFSKDDIIGYVTTGKLTYDLDKGKSAFKQLGKEEYIKQFNTWFETNTDGSCKYMGKEVESQTKDKEVEPPTTPTVKEKKVGSEELGYIVIPEDWVEKAFPEATAVGKQYYDNVSHYVTMIVYDTIQLDAKAYVDSVKVALEGRGATEISTTEATITNYQGYQVSAYDNLTSKWIYCYIFETENGKTHYIALEGPEKTHEYYNIYQTFTLN